MKKLKNNNSGISLVELLVAMAIGGIAVSAVVILLSQGVRGYTSQTISTQLQDDANVTVNNITDAVMEANYIDLLNNSTNSLYFSTKADGVDGNAYSYDPVSKTLYLGTSKVINNPTITTEFDGSSVLCKNVEEFKVEIFDSSVSTVSYSYVGSMGTITGDKIVAINNPVRIKVTLKLKLNGSVREVNRVITVRNEISTIYANGISVTDITTYPLKNEISQYFTN